MPTNSMAGVKQARQGERMEKIDASKLVIDDKARELEILQIESLMEESVSPESEKSTLDRYYHKRNLEHLAAKRDHHLQLARVHLSLNDENMLLADKAE